jgi:hypothetical protein
MRSTKVILAAKLALVFRGKWLALRLSALRLPSLRMILFENRTPLFGIMRCRG